MSILNLQNGTRLHFEKVGQGPDLIFLHGNGENLRIFDQLVAQLKPHFTCYQVDSRGHGQSSKVTNALNYFDMVDDVGHFIDEMHLDKPSILGFSDGAIVGSLLAIQEKIILDKLILLGINLNPDHIVDEAKKSIQRLLCDNSHDPILQLMVDGPDISYEDLNKIKQACLIVAGDHDILTVSQYSEISQQIPLSQLFIVPGANHQSYINNSDRIAVECLRFLAMNNTELRAIKEQELF